MKTWAVPYERTCRGTADVEAESATDAEQMVKAGDFEPDPGEETTDWDCCGSAKEIK